MTHADHREIVAARTVSPLVLGVGEGELFLASDVPALLAYTRQVVFLHDGDMVVLGRRRLPGDRSGRKQACSGKIEQIDWDAEAAEKGGFDTYMLKEIYEQPVALTNTLIGRLHDDSGEVKSGHRPRPRQLQAHLDQRLRHRLSRRWWAST